MRKKGGVAPLEGHGSEHTRAWPAQLRKARGLCGGSYHGCALLAHGGFRKEHYTLSGKVQRDTRECGCYTPV